MNILHLEDNAADAELFESMLLREWPECHIRKIWTRQEFETALQLESYDVILSDHSMPDFDGLTALEIARATTPQTPFIFLSGTIGEDRAIQAMKGGAADYVLKDAPLRFIAAVRGALADAEREAARRRAEDSLRKSREQFRRIAESIDGFIVLFDLRGQRLYSNPAFLHLIGHDRAACTIFDEIHTDDRGRFQALIDQVVRQDAAVPIQFRLRPREGLVRYIEARASYPPHGEDEIPTLLLTGTDVTERRRAEEMLHEQASLLQKARDAVCLFDLRFVVTQWTASAERLYGLSAAEAIGDNVRDLLFRDQTSRFDTAVALTLAHGEWHGEFRFRRADGCELAIDSSWSLVNDPEGRPKSILCINTDVTSRKQFEIELQRAQRIESLGMLAGGIAHDLNNILSPILMSVGLLRPVVQTEEDLSILDTLEASASHGTELVQQILLFARGGEGRRSSVALGKLLDGLQGFLKTTVRTSTELYLEHDENLWIVSADATQIKQVLVNLCINARDAMPRGGRIRITAKNVEVTPGAHRGFHGEIAAGRYVRLSVADNGSGIPPEVLDKIFDPFFTTKEIGKGTGLGLSTIAGIVQNHEGAIQVQNVDSGGTAFHIYLPVTAVAAPAPHSPSPTPFPKGGGEMILVIDDDEGIRTVAERILTDHDYLVCTAPDGVRGLEECERQHDRIKVVICDERMPGMSGTEVLDQIHRRRPDIKLIAMSGFTDDFSCLNPEVDGAPITLPKPLNSESLLRIIRQVLDA